MHRLRRMATRSYRYSSILQHRRTGHEPRCIIPNVQNFSAAAFTLAKNKVKKGAASHETQANNSDNVLVFDKSKLETSCSSVIAKLQKELQELRAGRQNPSILNNLKISSENTILSTLAAVTQKNPKTFLVTVYDPNHVKHISAAIASSGQNLNPQPVPNNPAQLTINIPKDSSSAKAEKVKALGQKAEQAKVQIRFLRGDAIKGIKKSSGSDDIQKKDEKTVGTIVDKFGKEIDKLLEGAKRDMDA